MNSQSSNSGYQQQNQYQQGQYQQNQYAQGQYQQQPYEQNQGYAAAAAVPEYAPARPPRPNTLGANSLIRDNRNHDSDLVPASERGEQIETFEQYENTRAQTREEQDRAQLQSEFKHVDGSLVAAIYGDAQGDMSYCREMLQALSE